MILISSQVKLSKILRISEEYFWAGWIKLATNNSKYNLKFSMSMPRGACCSGFERTLPKATGTLVVEVCVLLRPAHKHISRECTDASFGYTPFTLLLVQRLSRKKMSFPLLSSFLLVCFVILFSSFLLLFILFIFTSVRET